MEGPDDRGASIRDPWAQYMYGGRPFQEHHLGTPREKESMTTTTDDDGRQLTDGDDGRRRMATTDDDDDGRWTTANS